MRAYERGHAGRRAAIYGLYLEHLDRVNNWDLVDSSAEHIAGGHLEARDKTPLFRARALAVGLGRRIAIMATFRYVKAGSFVGTLRIADLLLADPHDPIRKAVGWMLREVGNRDRAAAEAFLRPRYRTMPRTTLRYAIERDPEALRRRYLRGEVA